MENKFAYFATSAGWEDWIISFFEAPVIIEGSTICHRCMHAEASDDQIREEAKDVEAVVEIFPELEEALEGLD